MTVVGGGGGGGRGADRQWSWVCVACWEQAKELCESRRRSGECPPERTAPISIMPSLRPTFWWGKSGGVRLLCMWGGWAGEVWVHCTSAGPVVSGPVVSYDKKKRCVLYVWEEFLLHQIRFEMNNQTRECSKVRDKIIFAIPIHTSKY
jgi:hypothetical protein